MTSGTTPGTITRLPTDTVPEPIRRFRGHLAVAIAGVVTVVAGLLVGGALLLANHSPV